MTREAALLGARSYTYFEQPLLVDHYLRERGLLHLVKPDRVLEIDWKKELRRTRRTVDLSGFEHPFEALQRLRRRVLAG